MSHAFRTDGADGAGRPDMVDWDLAVRIGGRLAGEGPTVGRDEAAAIVEELRAGADRSTGLVREFTGLVARDHSAPVLVVDRASWVQANADAFATLLVTDRGQAHREEAADRDHRSDRVAGHRRRGRQRARLPGVEGARPVRPVPRARRPAAARGAQHRARRARARGGPARLPALGLPARGDPPGAVHRGPVDARAHVRADPEVRRDHGAVRAAGGRPHPGPRGAQERPRRRLVRGQPPRRGRYAGAAGAARRPDRRDVAARGSRGRRHGRRRPDRHPVGRQDPRQVQRAPQGGRRPRPVPAPGARPRRQDGAVPRRCRVRPHGRRQRPGCPASTWSGSSPTTCPPAPRSPTPTPGWRACSGASPT